MDKQEFTNKLLFLFDDKNEIGLNMYIVLKSNVGSVNKKADLDQPVIKELKEKFLTRIKLQYNNNSDFDFSEITEANDSRNTIYHYNLPEKPQGLNILGTLLNNEHADLFNFANDDLRNISGFVFLIGNADNKIALYKKMYPISLLQRDSVLMLYKVKTRLVKLDEDILKINDDFDFIQFDDNLIVINVKILEKNFGYEDIIRRQTGINLKMIEDSGLLQNMDSLNKMAKELKYAKKIVKLKKDSPVLKLPFQKVKDFIKKHPNLRKRIKFNSDETKIVLDTNKSKELFLKLLDDDFLKSNLTELLYESEKKDPLGKEEE